MSTINTVDRDDEQQGSGLNSATAKWIVLVALILLSPLTALVAFVQTLLFSYVHIKQRVLIAFSAPILLIGLLFFPSLWASYLSSWETVRGMISGEVGILAGIFTALGQQSGFSLVFGIPAGWAINALTWFNRARWKVVEFRITPWEMFRWKKNAEKIANDEETPTTGVTLGLDVSRTDNNYGRREIQTWRASGAHTFMVGGSGSGKTSTATMRIRDQIANGDAVIILDLKADPEFTNNVANFANRYGRRMQHFILQDPLSAYTGPSEFGPAHYDPLQRGDATQRADMVLELRDWTGADYYKKQTQSYLLLLFQVLIANPNPRVSTLEDAISLFNPQALQQRAIPLASQNNPVLRNVVQSVDALNDEKQSANFRENLQTNRSQLEIFLQSVAGPWLRKDETRKDNNISLLDSSFTDDVVVFSIDSLKYGELAKNLANLITQDLKTVAGERLTSGRTDQRVHVFIDEFSAIESNNVIGLINKARAANMSVTIATQTLGDLETQSDTLKKQLTGIVSSFLIHRANREDEGLEFAGLTGKIMVKQTTENVEHTQNLFGGIGKGIGTGSANVKEVEQYKVPPSEFQKLRTGQFFFIDTTEGTQTKVQCILDKALTGGRPPQPPKLDTPAQEQKQGASLTMRKESDYQQEMSEASNRIASDYENQPTSNQLAPEDAFREISEMSKQPLNYELLKRMSNNPERIDAQKARDDRDGVVPTERQKRVAKLRGKPVPGSENATRATQRTSTTPTRRKQGDSPELNQSGGARKKSPFPSRPQRPTRPNGNGAGESAKPKERGFDF